MVASRLSPWTWFAIGIAIAFAFVLPPRVLAWARWPLSGLFAPISTPVRAVVSTVLHRSAKPQGDEASPNSPRPAGEVYADNGELLKRLAVMTLENQQLSRQLADQAASSSAGGNLIPATVTGVDSSGLRDGLFVSGVDLPGDRPAVRGHDLVGRVYIGGGAGSEVRLITDVGTAFTVRIGRYLPGPDGSTRLEFFGQLRPLVRGLGHGQMGIQDTLSMRQVQEDGVAVGDVVFVEDRDKWPAAVQGFMVGRITSVRPQQNAPLTADVRVEPDTDLSRLSAMSVIR